MRSKQAATMSDVAREAGVALGTVSKVINGQPVGEQYRLKVEAAVKKLDYQVNPSAKALKKQPQRLYRAHHPRHHHHPVFRAADPVHQPGAGKARL